MNERRIKTNGMWGRGETHRFECTREVRCVAGIRVFHRWPKIAQELICMCHHTHPQAPVLSDSPLIFTLCQTRLCRHVGMCVSSAMMHWLHTCHPTRRGWKFVELNGRKLTPIDFPGLTLHKLHAAANSITVTAITSVAVCGGKPTCGLHCSIPICKTREESEPNLSLQEAWIFSAQNGAEVNMKV